MEVNSENTIVYTILIGQNEGLNHQPQIKNSKLRHICLTDNENLKSDDWEMFYVKRLLPMDQYRSQRNLKIRPHLIFPEYKYSFYMDNTVVLKTKVEDFINKIFLPNILDEKEALFILPFHSFRETLIDEFYECFKSKLDSDIRFFEQITDYLLKNRKALQLKPYWTGMLFRNHMDSRVKEFSEIWFSNILRYSRRDQLSIIHSELQSNLKIIGVCLDNHKSDYHKWPVTKNERIFRNALNNIYKLPPDIFEEIISDLSLKDEEIKKIDFKIKIKEAFSKIKKSFHEFEVLEEEKRNLEEEKRNLEQEKRNLEQEKRNLEEDKKKLHSELKNIKNSRIWRYSALYRKIMDKNKKILFCLKKPPKINFELQIITFLKYSFYLKFKNLIIKNIQLISNLLNKEEVDVIIPVFNAKDYFDKCLESIFNSRSNYSINLLIINDGSHPEINEVLNKYSSNKRIKINVIHNSKNIGYTRSVNKGIRASKAKYVVVANSDILVVDYWLDRLIRGVLLKKRVGIVGPLTNAGSFQSIPEVFNSSGGLAINEIPFGMDNVKFDQLIESHSLNINPEIKIINGFCHLLTRNLIEEIGLLDEKNFPKGYCEEVDFSLRALSKKFKILVVDNLYIYHHKTKSFSRNEREELIKQNFLKLYKIHDKQVLDKHISEMNNNKYLKLIRLNIKKKLETTIFSN